MADRAQRMIATTDPPSQALVVGVSRYQHIARLPPNRDVAGVRDVLASPDYCAYQHVEVIEEEAATRDSVLRALDALCTRAKHASSRTFFYFSGHGGQGIDRSSYILPVDAQKGRYPATAISARELSESLDWCSGEVTVVLDCCYAAGMTSTDRSGPAASPGGEGSDLASFGDGFRRDIQSRGRVVFAASCPDGLSYSSLDAPFGIFTGHMLDALRGKASTDGLDVTVHQLFDYVQRHVEHSSRGHQRPSLIANIERFYRLTRYPRRLAPSVVFEKDVYLSYDRKDPVVRRWVTEELQPELASAGRSVWDHDPLGQVDLEAVQEALTRSKYVVVVLTRSYLHNCDEEFKATLAILQAIHTRTPRFIPILRERCDLPLAIQAFVGLDMTESNQMEFRYSMDRLIKRLAKAPHER